MLEKTIFEKKRGIRLQSNVDHVDYKQTPASLIEGVQRRNESTKPENETMATAPRIEEATAPRIEEATADEKAAWAAFWATIRRETMMMETTTPTAATAATKLQIHVYKEWIDADLTTEAASTVDRNLRAHVAAGKSAVGMMHDARGWIWRLIETK